MSHPHIIGGGCLLLVKLLLLGCIALMLLGAGYDVAGGVLLGGIAMVVVIALGIFSFFTGG